ncbi:triple gene block protein 3 [Vanilla virus X]|uniref:Movement protein TGBp3 n=1 Tax=Vanilla virus X TaxID=2016427 RepID=A0A220NQ63_9VIRU|nr:triple gene block protein 3 [Vanilla virus X]ASJ78788.1 triple gene block protein 3 [Vanilla virus X]
MHSLDTIVLGLLLLGLTLTIITIIQPKPCTLLIDGSQVLITNCKLDPSILEALASIKPLQRG